MGPGDTIVDRFEIVRVVGAGGMGKVYQALDRQSGDTVAFKLMHGATEDLARRFIREAAALVRISDPAVVGYVDHGVTNDGRLYLAMQWLEGEDLLQRLRRSALSPDEAIRLGRRIAGALASLHEAGIIHRDLKPANILLPDGDPACAMLLDFGIARLSHELFDLTQMTAAGSLIGTPSYIAPEQIRGQTIDARADLHALGVVLWESITHRRLFVAEDALAVVSRVLLDEAPPLRSWVPTAPEALDRLVSSLTEKRPEDRPGSAREVLELLEAIDASGEDPPEGRVSILTPLEQRVVSIVVGSTEEKSRDGASVRLPSSREAARARSARLAARFGARLEVIHDGRIVALVEAEGGRAAGAIRAARLARALTSSHSRLVVATGRVVDSEVPVGEAIDRAARLTYLTHAGEIRLDEFSAELLRDSFEVVPRRDGLFLGAPVDAGTGVSEVGALVGRGRELALLRGTLAESVSERRARGLLVRAPAGLGKSRLADELAAVDGHGVEVLHVRGDAMRSSSPYAMIAPALRASLGVTDEVGRAEARAGVLSRAGALFDEDVLVLAALLGELAGVPFPDDDVSVLRAARADPRVLVDLVRAAFVEYVSALARERPVLLLIDDLQWADRASVQLVDSCLRAVDSAPLAVIAFARPEVDELHPGLWHGREVTRVELEPLSNDASATLVLQRAPKLDEAARTRIVERASGNPYFLEELIHAAEHGRALPETVLATVQARLAEIEPPGRLVLRAAAVFGERFWADAVADLVGTPETGIDVDGWLERLVDAQIVERVSSTTGAPLEHRFVRGLVRDACYAMLTDDDRRRGHRRAGRWLAARGDSEPAVLATHFGLGGEAGEAAGHHLEAARRALAADDLVGAVHHATEARDAGDAETSALAGVIAGEAWLWSGRQREARDAALRAIDDLPAGSVPWLDAIGVLLDAAAALGELDGVAGAVEALIEAKADETRHRALTLARIQPALVFLERSRLAARIGELAEQAAEGASDDPLLGARLANGRAITAVLSGDLLDAIGAFRASALFFDRVGARRWAASQRANLGSKLLELGAIEDATSELERALIGATRGGFPYVVALAELSLGIAHRLTGDAERALGFASEAAEAFAEEIGDARLESAARSSLAEVLAALGRPEDAWAEATHAVLLVKGSAAARATALSVLARLSLDAGDAEHALGLATEAVALSQTEPMLDREVYLAAVHAEALVACGRTDEGRARALEAWRKLETTAASLADGELRRSFLQRVPEHRWLGRLVL